MNHDLIIAIGLDGRTSLFQRGFLLHSEIRCESRSSIFVIVFLKAKGCKFERLK